jgi:hypothetical protein
VKEETRTHPGGRQPVDGRQEASLARSLAAIADHARRNGAVRKTDIGFGDQIIVKTRNSVYSIRPLGDDTYAVCGGWFDGNRQSPATVRINGCTYGGSAIRHDIVAAPGLFLEFGNNVLTTRIKDVSVVRYDAPSDVN